MTQLSSWLRRVFQRSKCEHRFREADIIANVYQSHINVLCVKCGKSLDEAQTEGQ